MLRWLCWCPPLWQRGSPCQGLPESNIRHHQTTNSNQFKPPDTLCRFGTEQTHFLHDTMKMAGSVRCFCIQHIQIYLAQCVSWNGEKNHGDPTKTWPGPRITGSSPVLKIWINTMVLASRWPEEGLKNCMLAPAKVCRRQWSQCCHTRECSCRPPAAGMVLECERYVMTCDETWWYVLHIYHVAIK